MGKAKSAKRNKRPVKLKNLPAKAKRARAVKGGLQAGGSLFEPPIDPGASSRR